MDLDRNPALPLNRLVPVLAVILFTQSCLVACDGGGNSKSTRLVNGSETPASEEIPQDENVPPPEVVPPEPSPSEQLLKSVTIVEDPQPITDENHRRLTKTLYEFLSMGETMFQDYLTGILPGLPEQGAGLETGTISCDIDGSFHMTYEKPEGGITMVFDDCSYNTKSSSDKISTLSGTEKISWTQETGALRIKREFYDYEFSEDDDKSIHLNGIAELVISSSYRQSSYINLDLEANDSAAGTIRSNMRITYSLKDGADSPGVPTDISGRLAFENYEVADVSLSDEIPVTDTKARYSLTGSTEATANLTLGLEPPEFIAYGYDPNGDGLSNDVIFLDLDKGWSNSRFVPTTIFNTVKLEEFLNPGSSPK